MLSNILAETGKKLAMKVLEAFAVRLAADAAAEGVKAGILYLKKKEIYPLPKKEAEEETEVEADD